MEHDILLLVIGALITAFISFIFWLIQRFILNKSNNTEKQQLENFYAPIQNEIEMHKISTVGDAINRINELSEKHPNIIPEYFKNWKKLYSSEYRAKDYIYEDFKLHIKSNYIWLRKKYKYDNQKVSNKNLIHLDCYRKKSSRAEIINSVIPLFLVAAFFTGLLMHFVENPSNTTKLIEYFCLSGSVIGLIVYAIKSQIDKWMIND